MAPGIQHRVRFREHDKEALIEELEPALPPGERGDRRGDPVVLFLLTEYLYGVIAASSPLRSSSRIMVLLWYVMPCAGAATVRVATTNVDSRVDTSDSSARHSGRVHLGRR